MLIYYNNMLYKIIKINLRACNVQKPNNNYKLTENRFVL